MLSEHRFRLGSTSEVGFSAEFDSEVNSSSDLVARLGLAFSETGDSEMTDLSGIVNSWHR